MNSKGKTCKVLGAKLTYHKNIKNDPALDLYHKEKHRIECTAQEASLTVTISFMIITIGLKYLNLKLLITKMVIMTAISS